MSSRPKVLFLMLLFILLFGRHAYGQEEEMLFSRAIGFAESQKFDFAFLDFRRLSRSYPKSKYSKDALFAIGEYYFLIGDNHAAVRSFQEFIAAYPKSRIKQFALAHLLKISEEDQKDQLAQSLKCSIVSSQQLSFLFKKSKEDQYTSAMQKKYKVKYFIDKAEFYIDNEIFIKISY